MCNCQTCDIIVKVQEICRINCDSDIARWSPRSRGGFFEDALWLCLTGRSRGFNGDRAAGQGKKQEKRNCQGPVYSLIEQLVTACILHPAVRRPGNSGQ